MYDMDLPKHWMKEFFFAQTHVDLINADDALVIYDKLKTVGFEKNFHIRTQEAIAHHNRRGTVKLKTSVLQYIRYPYSPTPV